MATEEEFQEGDAKVDSPITDGETFICEVIDLVSETTGVPPLELPPLASTVDPEAVQQILRSGRQGKTKVQFQYADCEVLVTGEGELYVLDRSTQID